MTRTLIYQRKEEMTSEILKLNGGFTMGNIITIAVFIVGMIMGWSKMDSQIMILSEKILLKADKEVVEIQLGHIREDLSEIKTMIKELK